MIDVNFSEFLELFIRNGYVMDYTDSNFYPLIQNESERVVSKGNALRHFFDNEQIKQEDKGKVLKKLFKHYEESYLNSTEFKTNLEEQNKYRNLYPLLRNKFEQIFKSRKILIIGNGFDLSLGLHTTYIDFVKFCTFVFVLCSCKSIKKNVDADVKRICMRDSWTKQTLRSREIFYDAFCFFEESFKEANRIVEHMKENLYKDFIREVFMKEYDNVFSIDMIRKNTIDNIYENINEFVNKAESKLGRWMDVEKFILYYVTGKNEYKNVYYYKDGYLNSDYSKVTSSLTGLKNFCEDFGVYLRFIQKKLKNDDNSNLYVNKLYELQSFYGDAEEKLSNPSYILNYNYTETAKKIFGVVNPCEIVHVNGHENGDKSDIVFGYYDSTETSPAIANEFKKVNQRKGNSIQPKLSDITNDLFDLMIFGFSCSTSDTDTLKPLFLSNNLKSVIIYCFSEEEKRKIKSNIQEICGNTEFARIEPKINFLMRKDNIESNVSIIKFLAFQV